MYKSQFCFETNKPIYNFIGSNNFTAIIPPTVNDFTDDSVFTANKVNPIFSP